MLGLAYSKSLEKGWICKKKQEKRYLEQDLIKVEQFKEKIKDFRKEDLVYIDETGIGKGVVEEYRWTKKGTVSVINVQGKRQKRVNIIAAYTCEGIKASFAFEGSCNTQVFESYIENVLCTTLKHQQVVIMDNASFHKSKNIKNLIEAQGCQLLFLPPYSPEYNPIEHYWGVLKCCVKKVRKTVADIWEAIQKSLIATKNFGQLIDR